MIRLRDTNGNTKEINPKEFPFIEVLDLENKVISAFIVSQNSITKIDSTDTESFRYKNLFGVEFSKPLQRKAPLTKKTK